MADGLRRQRDRHFASAVVALALCAVVVAGAGCGSSSRSSSSARVSSTASSSSSSSSGSQRLTKAQYEQKLGPLLNDVVDPALRDVLSNDGARSARKLGAAITILRLSHDQMAALTPPAAVADLHTQAVAVLASMIGDMTKLRAAKARSDTRAGSAAEAALKTDAQGLETLGTHFTSRGY